MIPVFALRLICGLSAMWCLAPRRQITSGFFRIQMLLTLGVSMLLTVTAWQIPGQLMSSPEMMQSAMFATGLCLAFLAFAGSMAWTLERRKGGFLFALLILAFAIAGVVACAIGAPVLPASVAARIFDSLTAAGIIGGVTAAMLLGHWYLTATGMPLQPLINYTRLFGGLVLLRMVSALLAQQTGTGNGFLLALRWAGLLGPAILVPLTLRILRYRNTQSATGVLYAATILVFMGETAASLLLPIQANSNAV